MSSDAEKAASRRRMLRSALLVSAVGAAAILGIGGASRAARPGPASGDAKAPSASSGLAAPAPGGTIVVKVVYFGMPLAVTSTKEDVFVLKSPAYFRDLLSDVVGKHPVISAMIPTMIMSVNGVPGSPSTPMKDGDVVDLVPASAGG